MIATNKQITPVDELRKQLRNRFNEEIENAVQGPSEALFELLCDPFESSDSDRYPLFASMGKKDTAARRGPSRSGGAEPGTFSPPLDNMGVTKYRSEIAEPKPSSKKIMGGYDGGTEVGFNGTWSATPFKRLLSDLEQAQAASKEEAGDDCYVTLCGKAFLVNPHGAKCGVYYRYVLEGAGLKIYIHENPQGPMQPIRIRYGFEGVVGRDLFMVHLHTLEWLKELGFTVEKETVSRVDMQVMTERCIDDYGVPIIHHHVVNRAKKSKVELSQKHIFDTYTAGQRIQICIYDKRKELCDTRDEVKLNLLMNECLGGEFPEELTRIEFRLKRDALKYLGVNTMQDLLEKENAIVDFLTFDWFRILESPKVRGHENTQKLHPVWQEVRNLFMVYFPGVEGHRKPIERNNSRRELKCTGEALVKQAVGCLASAAAVVKGMFQDETSALSFVYDVLSENVKKLYVRTTERVKELGIVRGVEAPNALDWHLDPRYACASTESALQDFREVFDEDLQYERFRNYAVAGCPF